MKRFSKLFFAGASALTLMNKAKWLAFAADEKTSTKHYQKEFSDFKLFSTSDDNELAQEIAFYLKTKIGKLQVLRDQNNDKPIINIMEDVHSKVIYLVCSFDPERSSMKESIESLISTISAMKGQSPQKVNVILPYFGSSGHAGHVSSDLPYSQEDLSELLESAGADKIFTVNLNDDPHHHHQNGTLSSPIPLLEVDAHKLCASYFQEQRLKDVVIVSTNEALTDKVKEIKEKLEQGGSKVEIGMIRENTDNADKLNYIGESVQNRDVLLVDNIVDSGKPIYNISKFLKNNLGASSIHVFAPHGVLDHETVDFLDYSPISELVITNTLPLQDSYLSPKIHQISVAKLLADLIAQSDFHKNLQELHQQRQTEAL